jgi:hypothetical protein
MATTPYVTSIAARRDSVLVDLERCVAEHECTVVGSGFIDIITRRQRCASFIERISHIGVAAYLVTLWCDCTPENQRRFGCPHGYGGPGHSSDGYFSEMCEKDPFEISNPDFDPRTSEREPAEVVRRCNAMVLEYCISGMEARPEYSPCVTPGLWLAVPDDWRHS